MRFIRKNIKFTSLVMASLILLTSCTDENTFDNRNETVNFNGKELFKGIFFATGTLAEKVPSISNSYSYFELNKISDEQKNDYHLKMNEILVEIEKENPNYFKNFKSIIQTKNQLKIKNALREGSRVLFESAINLYLTKEQKHKIDDIIANINIEDFRSVDGSINYENLKAELGKNNEFQLNEQGMCWFAGVVFVAAAYVLVAHAAAAMTYVAVAWVGEYYAAVDQEKTITRDAMLEQTLKSEILINDLALLNIQ